MKIQFVSESGRSVKLLPKESVSFKAKRSVSIGDSKGDSINLKRGQEFYLLADTKASKYFILAKDQAGFSNYLKLEITKREFKGLEKDHGTPTKVRIRKPVANPESKFQQARKLALKIRRDRMRDIETSEEKEDKKDSKEKKAKKKKERAKFAVKVMKGINLFSEGYLAAMRADAPISSEAQSFRQDMRDMTERLKVTFDPNKKTALLKNFEEYAKTYYRLDLLGDSPFKVLQSRPSANKVI